MSNTILRYVNGTIPSIQSVGVNLTSTAATYNFNSHPNNQRGRFSGIIAVKIVDTITPPATAVPVIFATAGVSGTNQPVLTATGTPVTTADFPGAGIYLFFYDRDANQLKMLTGISA